MWHQAFDFDTHICMTEASKQNGQDIYTPRGQALTKGSFLLIKCKVMGGY